MSEKQYIYSPQEKKLLEPLLKYLTPEHIQGKKEVIINTPGEIGYEDIYGKWSFKPAPELELQILMDITKLLADTMNLTFSLANPILSLKLPGGHRAQVVAGIQNPKAFSMTIRLSQEREFKMEDYDMPEEDRQAIKEAIRGQKTILISGGTGSGKTSFMNAAIKFVPDTERLVTIEDVRELKVDHHNWVPFTFVSNSKDKSGPGVTDVLNACLRMRPDRILLGEIRQENAFTFCSAINTGHAGSMATIHANDPKSALDAVINRVLLNGDASDNAVEVLRRQLIADIYGVVQLNRVEGGVKGYFQVLDPDRAKREKAEHEERLQQNREAAAEQAQATAEKERQAQERMMNTQENE